jgi:hypothetical protein
MNYVIGILLAILVCGAALLLRLDRDRRFYTAMLIVIALLYLGFAIMGKDADALRIEAAISTVFVVVAFLGFRISPWLIVVALAAHGTYDITHHFFFQNRGVPGWYPGFCMTYDVVAAAIFAAILTWRKQQATGALQRVMTCWSDLRDVIARQA